MKIIDRVAGFLGVGAASTALHYAVLLGAVELAGLSPLVGASLGFVAGAALNYGLNRSAVFASTRRHAEGLPRFAAMALAGLLLNGMVVDIGARLLGLHYLLAQATATAVVMLFNFAVLHYWIFPHGRNDPNP